MIREKTIFRNILFGAALLVAGASAVALSSCAEKEMSAEPVVDGSEVEICFTPSLGNGTATKGADVQPLGDSELFLTTIVSDNTSNPFADVMSRATSVTGFDPNGTDGTTYASFGVYSYLHEGSWAENSGKATPYINGEEVVSLGNGYWGFEESVFWPAWDTNMTFFGYAPVSVVDGGGETVVTTPYIDFTDPAVPATETDKLDLSKQYDLLVAKTADVTKATSSVNMKFTHALTAVRFVCGEIDMAGTITKIGLSNVKYSGVYDMSAGTWDLTEDTYDYEIATSVDVAGVDANGEYTDKGSAILAGDATLMMLPQTLRGTVLTVEFTASDETVTTFTMELSTVWAAGSEVTYTISYSVDTPTPTNYYEEYTLTGKITIGDKAYKIDEYGEGILIDDEDYKFPTGSTSSVNAIYFVEDTITLHFTAAANIQKLILVGKSYETRSKVAVTTSFDIQVDTGWSDNFEIVFFNLDLDFGNLTGSIIDFTRTSQGYFDLLAFVDCHILTNTSYNVIFSTNSSYPNRYCKNILISNTVWNMSTANAATKYLFHFLDANTGAIDSFTMTNNLFYCRDTGVLSSDSDFRIIMGNGMTITNFDYENNTMVNLIATTAGAVEYSSLGNVTAEKNLTYVESPENDYVFFHTATGDGSGMPTGTVTITDNIAYHGGTSYDWYWFYSEELGAAASGFTDCQVLDESPFTKLDVETETFTVKTEYSDYGYQASTTEP